MKNKKLKPTVKPTTLRETFDPAMFDAKATALFGTIIQRAEASTTLIRPFDIRELGYLFGRQRKFLSDCALLEVVDADTRKQADFCLMYHASMGKAMVINCSFDDLIAESQSQ